MDEGIEYATIEIFKGLITSSTVVRKNISRILNYYTLYIIRKPIFAFIKESNVFEKNPTQLSITNVF